jgi:hypothetical protein
MSDDGRDAFWGFVFFLILALLFSAIVFPLLWLRTTFVFKPILFLAYPVLVIVAWNGYPLAYYKITGRRFIKRLPSNVHANVYGGVDGQLYEYFHRYDVDVNASLEERGFTPFEPQKYETFILGDQPNRAEKRLLRKQRVYRILFIFAIIALSESWLNGLGTSWRKVFSP